MDLKDWKQIPPLKKSNPNAQFPRFPLMVGEHALLLSKTVDGSAMITNFRFCVCERRSFINIPLLGMGAVCVVDTARRCRINCKDGSTYSCTFETLEDCQACFALLNEKTGRPTNTRDVFAYTFYMSCLKDADSLPAAVVEQMCLCQSLPDSLANTFDKEVERLCFDTSRRKIWRMSHANENFGLCATYPRCHIVPACIDDETLKSCTEFRAGKRFPSVVWRDKSSGLVLIRSSQPLPSFLGLTYFQNEADETLLKEIVKACTVEWSDINKAEAKLRQTNLAEAESDGGTGLEPGNGHGDECKDSMPLNTETGAQSSLVSGSVDDGCNGASHCEPDTSPRKLAIVDCRSSAGVWGNSLKGGGTEDEAAYKCNIIHLDLANIHTVRDSFAKLQQLCHAYVEGTYFRVLSGCNWINYISALLRGANIVVELIQVKKRPVLVHCSDGWDRTSQIVSLSELMMDSHYRTITGFKALVEREWLHFGHKFGERGGHDPNCTDTSQQSPIFLQFLDCVYQLTQQYPSEFQFNEAYLVKLLKHSQACLFGTFLHNNEMERQECELQTASVWSLLHQDNPQFINLLYRDSDKVLTAKYKEHDLSLWKSVYMAGLVPCPHSSQTDFLMDSSPTEAAEEREAESAAEGLPRTRSADDVTKTNSDNQRRSSDPNHVEMGPAILTPSPIHDPSMSSVEILQTPDNPALVDKPDTACVLLECPMADSYHQNSSETQEDGPAFAINGIDVASPLTGSNCNGCCHNDTPFTDEDVVGCAVQQKECDTQEDTGPATNGECTPDVSENSWLNGKETNTESDLSTPDLDSDPGMPNGDGGMRTSSPKEKPLLSKQDRVCNGTEENICVSAGSKASHSCLPDDKVQPNCQHSRGVSRAEQAPMVVPSDSQVSHSLTVEKIRRCQNFAQTTVDLDVQQPDGGCIHSFPDECALCPDCVTNGIAASDLDSQNAGPHHMNSISTDTLTGEDGNVIANVFHKEEEDGAPLHLAVLPDGKSEPLTLLPTSSISTLPSLRTKEPSLNGMPIPRENGTKSVQLSRRARAASGASRDLSISPGSCRGNWSDTGRLRHASGGEAIIHKFPPASVSTSTSDISDSHVDKVEPIVTDRHSSVRHHLDVDGLTLFSDLKQDLLRELLLEKDRKICLLERRIQEISRAGLDKQLSNEGDRCEYTSLGAISDPASDTSWEQVDEAEERVALWVPDETVTHCADCGCEFWRIFSRKHHCRNCGKIFCEECSKYQAYVQHVHYNGPQKVCKRCHAQLVKLSPGASSDGRIPTLVADG